MFYFNFSRLIINFYEFNFQRFKQKKKSSLLFCNFKFIDGTAGVPIGLTERKKKMKNEENTFNEITKMYETVGKLSYHKN